MSKVSKFVRMAALLALPVAFTGCMTYPVAMGDASTYISPNDRVTEIGPASGSAFGGIVMGLPIGETRQMELAIQRAVKSSGGDALVGVTADYKTYNFMVVMLMRTSVRGTAVKIQKGAAAR